MNGRTLRVRQYPWGCVQVENESHCDFVRLREMLLRVNMEDLRERTHTVHYETYRKGRLTEMGFRDDEKISLQVSTLKRCELIAYKLSHNPSARLHKKTSVNRP